MERGRFCVKGYENVSLEIDGEGEFSIYCRYWTDEDGYLCGTEGSKYINCIGPTVVKIPVEADYCSIEVRKEWPHGKWEYV